VNNKQRIDHIKGLKGTPRHNAIVDAMRDDVPLDGLDPEEVHKCRYRVIRDHWRVKLQGIKDIINQAKGKSNGK